MVREITLREVLQTNYLRESGSGESLSGGGSAELLSWKVVRENYSAGSRSAEKGLSGRCSGGKYAVRSRVDPTEVCVDTRVRTDAGVEPY